VSVVIETQDLTKVYKGMSKAQDLVALNKLNIQVNEGEIFGYLGPNGSGKTTTIKLLLSLIFPTGGKMKIMGNANITSPEVRKNIGYLPEGAYYPDFLRGEEILSYYGSLYGMRGASLKKRIDEVLEVVGMTRARKRLIRGYSKGMRQRIGLAQALLSDPGILILDEPTTGLDPVARKEIRDLLIQLRDQGKSLLISSHELLEVELISDRVGILFEGVLQTSGTIDELLTSREFSIKAEEAAPEATQKVREAGLITEDAAAGRVSLRVPENMSLYQALDICKSQNMKIVSVSPRRETLEEVFVRVVGSAVSSKEAQRGER
jgi:ABC-2 type transport system ATP-binding protein